MLKYRNPKLWRVGILGVALSVMIVAVGLQPGRLYALATAVRYQAQFTEAGGLNQGNDVILSGVKVGTVLTISLERGKALVTFSVDGRYQLGSQTTAHIETGSLLGERVVTLVSEGNGTLRPLEVIPVSRTSSPYSLTQAVSDLTTNTADTDTASLNQSLDTLAVTLDQVAPQLSSTFDGISRVSRSITSRNDTMAQLLEHAADVTRILSDRNAQINTLILNANDLVGVLNERRQAIVDLLGSTSVLAKQLSGLVADNEKELAPTLEKLNSVTAMLEKNRDNIGKAIPGLAKFEVTQGETVANGFYYTAYVPNLNPAQILQPFMDYAFGLRRGSNAGQPPDNAGPRAEIPFPVNGIPQPGDLPPR
jgi:phospholipid/cholesterol/gamma-HCH transport system substrate-binding protein